MKKFKYFTYIQGPRRAEPQIWYGEITDGGGKAKPSLIKPVQLELDDIRTLEELELAYPIEAV